MTAHYFTSEPSVYAAPVATIAMPTRVRAGDTLLAIMCVPNVTADVIAPEDWEEIVTLTGGTTAQFRLYRHTVGEVEPAGYDWTVDPAPASEPLGAIVLFRDMDPAGVVIDSEKTDYAVAAALFVAADVNSTQFLDLWLAVFFTLGAPVNVDHGLDPFERFEYDGVAASTLSVGSGTAGGEPTGTVDGNLSAARTGIAVSVTLSTAAMPVIERTLPASPKRIGLPLLGV